MKYTQSFIPLASLTVFTTGCQDIPEGNGMSPESDPPNILFLVSEDNSPFLGAYGDPYAHTPNLDELAENGILYENAFANAPVCAPSRSTIITGMYANSLGSHHMRSRVEIPEKLPFLPLLPAPGGLLHSEPAEKGLQHRGSAGGPANRSL